MTTTSLTPSAVAPAGALLDLSTGTQRAGRAAASAGLGQRLRDYVTLTKPHIISLLLVTTAMPMVVAAAGWPGGWPVFWAMLGGYLMAGSANATNMVIDRDIDSRMTRTRLRPIPAGRMSARHALVFAALLMMAAMHVLAAELNALSAGLALAGWLWYVGVYTLWLKRRSPHACMVGGAAGAFPPMIGWAAVTGEIGLVPVVLFLIVFLWTPPHFWALALIKQKEYGAAGLPMAPNAWGEAVTRRRMLLYTLALIPVTMLPWPLGVAGASYAAAALALGLWFLGRVARVAAGAATTMQIWSAYRTSLLYLALLFTAMAVDVVLRPFSS